MAIGTDALVDGLAAAKGLVVPSRDQAGVIHATFVFGNGKSQQGRGGLQLLGTCQTAIANLHQVTDQIQELLPAAQLIHLTGWHDRQLVAFQFFNFRHFNRDQLAIASHIAEHDVFRCLFDQQRRNQTSVDG